MSDTLQVMLGFAAIIFSVFAGLALFVKAAKK